MNKQKMKTKLIGSPTGICTGCIYHKPGYSVRCIRPEDVDSCLIQSGYGVRAGIYVEDNKGESHDQARVQEEMGV